MTIKLTLGRLMVVVCLISVLLAFLRHMLTFWGPTEVTIIALAILMATNVLAWFQNSRRQVFWAGFGFLGWAYLTIALASPAGEHLPTTRLIDVLHDRMYPAHTAPEFGSDSDEAFAGPVHAYHFRRAGHSTISLVLAFLGGVVARLVFPAKDKGVGETFPPDGSLLKPGWRVDQRKTLRGSS